MKKFELIFAWIIVPLPLYIVWLAFAFGNKVLNMGFHFMNWYDIPYMFTSLVAIVMGLNFTFKAVDFIGDYKKEKGAK